MLLFWSCYNPSIHFFRNLQKRSFTRRECDGPPNTRSVYSTGRRLYYNLKTKRHPLSLGQLTGAAQGNSVIRDLRMVLVPSNQNKSNTVSNPESCIKKKKKNPKIGHFFFFNLTYINWTQKLVRRRFRLDRCLYVKQLWYKMDIR